MVRGGDSNGNRLGGLATIEYHLPKCVCVRFDMTRDRDLKISQGRVFRIYHIKGIFI